MDPFPGASSTQFQFRLDLCNTFLTEILAKRNFANAYSRFLTAYFDDFRRMNARIFMSFSEHMDTIPDDVTPPRRLRYLLTGCVLAAFAKLVLMVSHSTHSFKTAASFVWASQTSITADRDFLECEIELRHAT